LAVEEFRKARVELLAAWSTPLAERAAKPQPTAVERRAAKVTSDLDRWQRKLKLAQTKIRKLKQRAKYYERRAAATPPRKESSDASGNQP
jgi:hypothetical protein